MHHSLVNSVASSKKIIERAKTKIRLEDSDWLILSNTSDVVRIASGGGGDPLDLRISREMLMRTNRATNSVAAKFHWRIGRRRRRRKIKKRRKRRRR